LIKIKFEPLAQLHIAAAGRPVGCRPIREAKMAVASVTKITAASPTSFDAAVQEGLARASKTLRGITGLHLLEQKASVNSGKIAEYRVTMEVTFILEQ
jgi:dodecin